MIIIAGTVRIDPAKREAAQDVIRAVITKSREEDGCIEYNYAVDVLDTSIVHVYEIWRDEKALQAHFKTDHLQVWRQSWSTFGISDRKLQRIEVASMSAL